MAQEGTANRRRHRRVPLATELHYYRHQQLHTTIVENISEDGLRFGKPSGPLDPGDQLKLFVALPPTGRRPGAALCLFQGKVVWVRNGMAGLRFEDPPQESTLEVRNFVEFSV